MERSLRERLRAGEAAAFGELFDEQADVVYRHALRLSGDRGVAEDIVSGTFLQAWRSRERIEAEGGSPRPWLLGIATNLSRDRHRRDRRDRELLARAVPVTEVPDFTDDLAAALDDARALAAVRAALARLRPEEREVLALCVWAELDYADAARALGIPIGTIRSRLFRARRKLARALGEPDPPSDQLTGGRPIVVPRPAPEGES